MRRSRLVLSVLACFVTLAVSSAAHAHKHEMTDAKISTQPAAGSVHMLTGHGGNIGICAGPDGVLLVDSQFAQLTDKIKAAVSNVSDQPIRFMINTHWHFDHTGGNENLGGDGTVIVAHENVRKRLSTDQFVEFFQKEVPALKPAGLPVVTFTRDIRFHLGGEDIRVFHLADAHTDGDAVVHFQTSNVLHAGDIYFEGMYPFIDTGSGGGVDGMIAAAGELLKLINDETVVIPGHGPMADKAQLAAFRDMLIGVRAAVQKQIDAGKTLVQTQAAKPTAAFDAAWGGGFLNPDAFTAIVYTSLTKK